MGDGSIRINKIENDDPTNLSDYWLLHMHDNLNGQMSICFSHDHEYLVTAGADGNLFTYKWNAPIEKGKAYVLSPVIALGQKVYDIDDPSHLSLEQQKQKDNHDRRMAIADEKKRGVLLVIEGLRHRYQKILERNNRLPLSQQLTPVDLEVDPRLTADLTMKLVGEMEMVNRKMAFDVEKEKLAGRKLLEYFIEPLQSFPIEVIGINTLRSVKTIRIQKLTDEFHGLKEDLKERIRRDKERKR
jgi:cilia- and flagella-associated protein 44